MEGVFLHLVNMSLSATPLMLGVILARWLMKRAPRWMVCLLWGVVALRLICPVSFESPVGLMPSQPPVTEAGVNAAFSGFADPGHVDSEPAGSGNSDPETVIPDITPTVPIPAEAAPEQRSVTEIAALVWLAGVAGMLLYLLASYLRLRRMVREAAPLGEGIWLCDGVKTPFILGVVSPKIYLPSGIGQEELVYVLAHERAHLRRKDHWWKPLGFLVLAVFWFHPLVWVSYVLACRDIELACDEKVIGKLGMAGRKAYSAALLECSTTRRQVFACPLAFGEVAVKDRILNILHYKKPGFWIIALSLVLILAGTVCAMTARPQKEVEPEVLAETAPVETLPPQAAEPETTAVPISTQPAEPAPDSGEWADYPDGIRIEEIQGETYTAHVMLVRNPAQVYMGLSTQNGFATTIPGKRIHVAMEDEGAIAAVNAGGFFDDGTTSAAVGSTPLGLVMSNGECAWERGAQPGLEGFAGFNQDNVLVVSHKNLTKDEVAELGIRDGCCFGPALIINGEVNSAVYEDSAGYNPRTAIGQREDGAVIFVCIDGRQPGSLGGTYADIIDIMRQYGAVSACNMDGGSSTVMMYRDTYHVLDVSEEKDFGGDVKMVNNYSLLQAEPRRMPNFWMVRAGE